MSGEQLAKSKDATQNVAARPRGRTILRLPRADFGTLQAGAGSKPDRPLERLWFRERPKGLVAATRLGQGVNNSFTDDRRFFTATKPDRSRCSTGRLATIADMSSSALWTRLRPLLTQDGWVRDYSSPR